MARSSNILNLGITILILSLLCPVPAMADVTPVNNFTGTRIGSISYTLIPDKPAYRAGDVITYIFQLGLACCDPMASFEIDHLLDLTIRLDPHITDITSNADSRLTGGGDGITGNTGSFYDAGQSLAWGFGYPPMKYLISNSDWPWGPALRVTGKIRPGTPPGTKISTTSYVGINANIESGNTREIRYTGATDTSDVMVTPEFPSPALPAGMVLGLLGMVFMVRGRRR